MKPASKRPLSLYLHFPFCVRKCRYCDFLSFPADDGARQRYLDRLEAEIRFRGPAYRDCQVVTVFVGGGTPSIMTPDQIRRLFGTLYECFDISPTAEISMECNPGTADPDKLLAMRAAGVNRISFGLQSMDDRELAYLGRIHTAADFLESYRDARRAGFDNINVDLMSALPGQTLSSYKKGLEAVLELKPEHISAYSLIIEEGTPFWQLYGTPETAAQKAASLSSAEPTASSPASAEEQITRMDGGRSPQAGQESPTVRKPFETILPLPSEEEEREMYALTGRLLAEAGYHRYEISNYTEAGYECAHNKVYWQRGDYLGLGLGAASLVGDRRFGCSRDMKRYLTDFTYEEEQHLSLSDQMEEMMFLGLRLTKGVAFADFRQAFGREMTQVYGEVLKKHRALGLLEITGDRAFLTERGLDLANTVMADFLF